MDAAIAEADRRIGRKPCQMFGPGPSHPAGHPNWFYHKGGLHVVEIKPGRVDFQTAGLWVTVTHEPSGRDMPNYIVGWQFAADIDFGKPFPERRVVGSPYFLGRVCLSAANMARAFFGAALAPEDQEQKLYDCTDEGMYFMRFGECLNIPNCKGGPLRGGVSFGLYPGNEYQPAIRKAFSLLVGLEHLVD